MSHSIIHRVEALVSPILDEEGFELVDIEYTKEGSNWFLRIFIDSEQKPVDLDHCSRISERVSKKLDETDPIPTAYILEVSSPGAERPLKKEADYQKAIGKNVNVSTYVPIHGAKEFQGVLTEVTNEQLSIQLDKKNMVAIPRTKVAKARLAIVF